MHDMATYFWWESNLIPICVDIAIDAEWGNLLKHGKLWLDLIYTRRVSGGHAGPPCETFSFARWIEQTDRLRNHGVWTGGL